MKYTLAFAGLVALSVLAAAWSMSGSTSASTREATSARIAIDNFTFTAPTVTINAGTGVTWVNKDDVPHTVMSEDKSFKSAVLDTGDTFTHTFSAPGSYTYYCSIHPRMVGKVIVR